MADQGKSGYGYSKCRYGNQWQGDIIKGAKPTKGKGKYGNQWAHQNPQDEWYDEQGTKNGGNRAGWLPNATHQGQLQGQNAKAIQGIAPPNQRDAGGGAHPDAYVRLNQRGSENQVQPAPPSAGQEQHTVGLDGHWQQPPVQGARPNQPNQSLRRDHIDGEAEAGSEHELFDETAAAHQGDSKPIRAESVKLRSATYGREDREQSPVRQRSVSRARLSSRSVSPAASTIPERLTVTSDVEDEYSRVKSTSKLQKDIREYRRTMAKTYPASGLYDTLRA